MNQTNKDRLIQFNRERKWGSFHTPSNLAKSLIIEAAELLEHFQWDDNYDIDGVAEELADILIYAEILAEKVGLDTDEIVAAKLEKNARKYPVDKAKGNSKKYTEF